MNTALQTLLEESERQRDAALTALLQAEDAVRRLRIQAEQLHAYRVEYRSRHPAHGGRSTGVDLLRVHEAFMQRLDQALQQQAAQLGSADSRASTLRTALLDRETRVASVRKLLERRDEHARRGAERQEQHRSDESAQARRPDPQAAAGWRLGSEPMPLAN